MNKNLNVLQFVESSVRFNEEVKKIYFVQYYWLEIIKYRGEEKERFKYLSEESEVRKWYDDVLLKYEIDMKYVRFFDIKNIYNKG